MNTSFDTQLSGYMMKDFAFTKLHERYKRWTGHSFEDKFMLSFGLVNEKGELTNAGALLADDCPIRYSRVFCTHWNGLNKAGGSIDAYDSRELSGSLIYLVENGEDFIRRNYKLMWRKTADSREEMPDYVDRSYHEALINALAHRDYTVFGSEVHIDIFDDRMEIYSPGGMADGINIQDRNPLTVPSTRRNPLLADVFERLGYMERKGSGLEKILDSYSHQINYTSEKTPKFCSDRAQFTVILPNLNYELRAQAGAQVGAQARAQAEAEDIENIVLSILKANPTITIKALALRLNCTDKKARYWLDKLKESGIIAREGTSQKGKWVIKTDNQI